jgi:hypothetical protein
MRRNRTKGKEEIDEIYKIEVGLSILLGSQFLACRCNKFKPVES